MPDFKVTTNDASTVKIVGDEQPNDARTTAVEAAPKGGKK